MTRPLRILHVGTNSVPVGHSRGGALQRRILELGQRQSRAGHSVTIAGSPGVPDSLKSGSLDFIEVPSRLRNTKGNYEFLLRLAGTLRGRRFDVLHAHGQPHAASVLGSYALATFHSVDYFEYRGSRGMHGRRLFSASLERFDLQLPVSNFTALQLARYYPRVSDRIAVFPNGVDLKQFDPRTIKQEQVRDKFDLANGRTALFVGRLSEQKGSDLLADLQVGLDSRGLNCRVVAAGPFERFGNSERSELARSLEAAGVRVLGPVDEPDLAGLMSLAEVFVLPTRRHEMFGMAALEALATGTPVVASDLGGIPEAVGPGGLLFPPGDAGAFIDAVTKVLCDAELRESLVLNSRQHVESLSWDTLSPVLEDIYRKTLNRG